MTFYVNGIKQDKIRDLEDVAPQTAKDKKDKDLEVELLFLTDNEALVKDILEKTHIIILTFWPYKWDIDTFGSLYAKIAWQNETLELRSPLTNLKTLCEDLFRIGLSVVDINSYSDPIEIEMVQKLLVASSQQVVQERDIQKSQILEKRNLEKKIYSDAKLNAAKTAVDWLVSRAGIIIQRTDRSLSFGELKKLRDLQETLKKLRMGNNYEKMKEAGTLLFKLTEELNKRYYTSILDKSTYPIRDSIVSDIDIYRELDKLEFAQQGRKIGVSLSVKKNIYAFLGRVMIFASLLQKDISDTISRPISMLYRLYDIIGIVVLFALCLSGSFLVLDALFQLMPSLFGMEYWMIQFGALGLIIYVLKYLRQKNLINLLMIYGGTVLLYLLARYFITTNFAL